MYNVLTFPFTDPVEELLLTEGDGTFISRVSFKEATELVYNDTEEKWFLESSSCTPSLYT